MDHILKHKTILLFDGYCNLCHSSVQFVLRHEKKPELYFTALQSSVGLQILNYYKIDPTKTQSLVLIQKDKAYIKSSAALRVALYLKGLFVLGFAFIIVPAFIRDWVYDFISKNRYRWYGKRESCIVPDENLAKRFL